jgi:hypothetical protein
MIRALLLAACFAGAGCVAGFQTVESEPDHVTYRFDPQRVSPDRVSAAATIHCEDSPAGSLRAVAVAETIEGPDRVVRYDCTSLPALDLNRAIEQGEQRLKKDFGG